MASKFSIETNSLPLNRSAGFSQKVVDGLRDLLFVLAADGRVLHVSQMCYPLTTFTPQTLIGKHITTFMHFEDLPVFLAEFTKLMRTGNSWSFHHRLRRRDDTFAPFESTFRPFIEENITRAAGLQNMPMCLMTSRLYPVACTGMMDSFLEHWATQARLCNELDQLTTEAEEFCQNTISATACRQDGNTIECASIIVQPAMYQSCELPIDKQNVSINHTDMGTAILHTRTVSGSSSTKPNHDSVLGDMGIEITTSRLQVVQDTGLWAAKPRCKKKKDEIPEERLCQECGTNNSPEWRRGPCGPKTLCNACGLRWSKTNRKRGPPE